MKKEGAIRYIFQCAITALLYEVSASPKPGLVDRLGNGAHKDMDFFTFIDSSGAISLYFYFAVKIGANWSKSPKELFIRLREEGKNYDSEMFEATNGVNTHKGQIFSLGLVCAAAGLVIGRNNKMPSFPDISDIIKQMTAGIIERDFTNLKEKKSLSNGEKLYLKYGVPGIRGEAESGFKSVEEISLPIMEQLMAQKEHHVNNVLLHTLLHLMSAVEDTNILWRHDYEILGYVHKKAKEALRVGGALSIEGMKYISEMDTDFIMRNISPGGSADLLAVTAFFYLLTRKKNISLID